MNQISCAIPLAQAIAGMVLAEDVRQADGSILLSAGASILESHLTSLQRRDVKEITVVSLPSEPDAAALAAQRCILQEAVNLQVQRIFRQASNHPLIQALIRTVLEYRLEKLP